MVIIITLVAGLEPVRLPAIPGSVQDMAHFLHSSWFGVDGRWKKIRKQESNEMDFIMPIILIVAYILIMRYVLPKMGIPT
jgi:hypothetical protein